MKHAPRISITPNSRKRYADVVRNRDTVGSAIVIIMAMTKSMSTIMLAIAKGSKILRIAIGKPLALLYE
jgi:hypothetical protein